MGLEGNSRKDAAEIAKDTVFRHSARCVVEVGAEDNKEPVGNESYAEQKEDQSDGNFDGESPPGDPHDGEDDSTNGGIFLVSFDLSEYTVDARAVAESDIRSLANAILVGFVSPVVQARPFTVAWRLPSDPNVDGAPLQRHHLPGVVASLQAQGDGDICTYSRLDIVGELFHSTDHAEMFLQRFTALSGDGGLYAPVAVLVSKLYSYAGGSRGVRIDLDLA